MTKLIIAHSTLATLTVLINNVFLDITFGIVTFIIMSRLLIVFRHLCLDKAVEEN